jgi:hypothetical protein
MSDNTNINAFIKQIENQVRKQLKGNYQDFEKVKLVLKNHSSEILKGETTYKLDITIDKKTGAKAGAKTVPNGMIQQEIHAYLGKLQNDPNFNEAIKQRIKKQPYKGFAADKDILKLTDKSEMLAEENTCQKCGQKGKIQCHTCRGQGQIQCQYCYATGLSQCTYCMGTGRDRQDNRKNCQYCYGQGKTQCLQCRGRRVKPCQTCQTSGMILCQACKGQGKHISTLTLTPVASLESKIHIQDLSDQLKNIIGNKNISQLITKFDIPISDVKPPELKGDKRYYFEEKPQDDRKNTLYYEAKIDWTIIEFDNLKTSKNIYSLGKKPKVLMSGHFMRDVTHPIADIFDTILSNRITQQSIFEELSSYNVSRETFSLLKKYKPKKVLSKLHQNYPLGWPKKDMQAFVKNAYLSLKKMTRTSRYIGLTLGLITSVTTAYIYSLKSDLFVSLNIIAEYAVLYIGMTVTTLVVTQLVSFLRYRKIMNLMGIKTIKPPPLGKALYYAILGNSLIIIGLHYLTHY